MISTDWCGLNFSRRGAKRTERLYLTFQPIFERASPIGKPVDGS
jgi:hypothetical protein